MIVLVDTSILSLALRREKPTGSRSPHSPAERLLLSELTRLITTEDVAVIGPIRQELLSGIRDEVNFVRLRKRLDEFPTVALRESDFDRAAQCYNLCRSKGVAGTPCDMLICAVALRASIPIFSRDTDFARYAAHLPIRLHEIPV